MAVQISPMTIQDYDEVLALWQASEGVGLSNADSAEAIAHFLAQNPGLSFVARRGAMLAGAVLCGHDGRRGYIYHLAVNNVYKKKGIGRALIEHCLAGLKTSGIQKCHIFVYSKNLPALAFWEKIGWLMRNELVIMSKDTEQEF
jgi:ribosomal protein S18 acetylase RimI-like enzyme